MRETDAQMLITIFGGNEILSESLGITSYPDEVRVRILERFCECVFKRILLCVPQEYVGSVIDTFEEHRASARVLETLVDSLRRYIPNVDDCMREELERAMKEFNLTAVAN